MSNPLARIELQKILFKKVLNRLELQSCPVLSSVKTVKIHVYRNHAFEPIASVIDPFLNYSGIRAEFSYSGYDDSLSFSNIPDDADVILLWIDLEHYGMTVDIKSFLGERLKFLRGKSKADIVLVALTDETLHQKDFDVSGCYIADVNELKQRVEGLFYDDRLQKVTATRLSNAACLQMARWLGSSLLPPLFYPNVKALVLDLDNTLYSGVLGEDGIDGIILTDGHRKLQEKLKELKEQGFFLSVASKNEIEDVRRMFEKRKDFPLVWEDFSAIGISWDTKVSNIVTIAEKLRIAPDSMVFVDDNIGEIIAVASGLPGIRLLLSDAVDAGNTLEALVCFPGLFKWHRTGDDTKRMADLQSNEVREVLKQSLSQEEYMKQLRLRITYRVNSEKNIFRIAELGGKTNQFIFSYQRLKEQEVKEFMQHKDWDVIDFSLKDNLSDSGLIGVVLTKFSGEILTVEDMFISCRALGREIEDVMILKAIDIVRRKYSPKEVKIRYKKGERNQPALTWLQKMTKHELRESGDVILAESLFAIKSDYVSVSIE